MHNKSDSDPLLILFHPGTRGDFLALLLLDKIEQHYTNYCMITEETQVFWKEISKNYIKLHKAGPADEQQINQLCSVKINFTPNDHERIARLWRTKQLPYSPKIFVMHQELSEWDVEYKPLDQKFKHVVNFADLFDINFLIDFYHRVNNKKMPSKYIPMIKHNIDLQSNHQVNS
jgi:hypothetical protein